MQKLTFNLLLFLLLPTVVLAHPGNTDSSGCHTCRTNCSSWGLSAGEYHCHNSKGATQPKTPVKSTYGENGTGYTSPAPEYSNNNSKTTTSGTGSTDTNNLGATGAFGGAALVGAGLYKLYRKIKK